MSIDGSIADTRVRLASVRGTADKGGIFRRWFYVFLMRRIQSVDVVSNRYARSTSAIVNIAKLYCARVAFKYCLLNKIKVWKNNGCLFVHSMNTYIYKCSDISWEDIAKYYIYIVSIMAHTSSLVILEVITLRRNVL